MSKTRRCSFEARGAESKGDVWDTFFTERVVDAWKALAGIVVETDIVVFQRLLNRHMDIQGMVGCGSRLNWHHVQYNIVGQKVCSCTVLSMFYILCLIFRMLVSLFFVRPVIKFYTTLHAR